MEIDLVEDVPLVSLRWPTTSVVGSLIAAMAMRRGRISELVPLLLTFVVRVGLVVTVLGPAVDDACGGADREVRLTCLMVYTAEIASQMVRIARMAAYLRRLPTSHQAAGLRWIAADGGFDPRVDNAVSPWFAPAVCVGMLLPLAALAVVRWWFGCATIRTSDDNVEAAVITTILILFNKVDAVLLGITPDQHALRIARWPTFTITEGTWLARWTAIGTPAALAALVALTFAAEAGC